MAFLGRDDAKIALGETAEAGVTVTLAEAFSGYATTVNAFNMLQVFDSYRLSQPVIQGQLLASKLEIITYRAGRLGTHLVQVALELQRHGSSRKTDSFSAVRPTFRQRGRSSMISLDSSSFIEKAWSYCRKTSSVGTENGGPSISD